MIDAFLIGLGVGLLIGNLVVWPMLFTLRQVRRERELFIDLLIADAQPEGEAHRD